MPIVTRKWRVAALASMAEQTVTLANDGFAGRTVTLPPRSVSVREESR